MWNKFRVFDETSKKEGEYALSESPLHEANFVKSHRIHLEGLSPALWDFHKGLILRLIALQYEKAYLAAIDQQSEVLLLAPGATKEQYSAMIEVLARAHRVLSPFLWAREVSLLIPDSVRNFNVHKGREGHVKAAVDLLQEHGARIFLLRGSSDFDVEGALQSTNPEHSWEKASVEFYQGQPKDKAQGTGSLPRKPKGTSADRYFEH